jgi:hypothetical protein
MARKKKKKSSFGLLGSITLLVVTFFARKLLSKSYTKVMGQKPPKAGDRNEPLSRVVTWTALSTISMSVVESVVQKYLGKKTN